MFMDIAESIFSELDDSDNSKYYLTIIYNNRTCWNSTYLAIQ